MDLYRVSDEDLRAELARRVEVRKAEVLATRLAREVLVVCPACIGKGTITERDPHSGCDYESGCYLCGGLKTITALRAH
jgi:hypothetical protein